MRRSIIWIAILLGMGGVALAQPAKVIIIRHAEKPDVGNELSPRGRERAKALAPYLLSADDLLKGQPPAAIYAQRAKHETSSVRSIQTVQPLSDATKVVINKDFERDDFAQMVAEVLSKKAYRGKIVVICWEHKVIPEMAKQFGVTDAPTKWPGETYDRTWVITFKPGEKPRLTDLPQHLLPGDADK